MVRLNRILCLKVDQIAINILYVNGQQEWATLIVGINVFNVVGQIWGLAVGA